MSKSRSTARGCLMKVRAFLLSACVGGFVGCGPSGVVPMSPNHPANVNSTPGESATQSDTLTMTDSESSAPSDMGDTAGHQHHAGHGKQAGQGTGDTAGARLIASEMSAFKMAKPVFDEYCTHCHTSKGKAGKHLAMDGYPFGGHHTGEVGSSILTVLGVTGKKPTMPKDDPGAVKGEQLAAIVRWAEAYEVALAAKAGHHKDHGSHGGHNH